MFRIGDFSKIAQVSGRLLRYYDEIGLLSPEFTDPQTGYRYYSARQLPRLNRILVLKELGLSLEQIARLVGDATSADELRGMLTLRKAQIEQTVQDELARLRVVEARLQQIEAHGYVEEPDVVLKSVPAQRYLSLRETLPDMDATRRLVESMVTIVPAVVGQHNLDYITVVVHSPVYEPDALDLEIGYLIVGKSPPSLRLSEERTLTLRELPAIDTVATLAHAGRIADSHQGYSALASWVEQHPWQTNGTGREVLVQLPQPDGDGAVVELQMPVKRSEA